MLNSYLRNDPIELGKIYFNDQYNVATKTLLLNP